MCFRRVGVPAVVAPVRPFRHAAGLFDARRRVKPHVWIGGCRRPDAENPPRDDRTTTNIGVDLERFAVVIDNRANFQRARAGLDEAGRGIGNDDAVDAGRDAGGDIDGGASCEPHRINDHIRRDAALVSVLVPLAVQVVLKYRALVIGEHLFKKQHLRHAHTARISRNKTITCEKRHRGRGTERHINSVKRCAAGHVVAGERERRTVEETVFLVDVA